jgi:predicted Zn-dependent protease
MNRSLKNHLSLGVTLAGLFSCVQTGLAGPEEPGLKITLSVHNYASIEPETLIRAEQEVTRIYREIAVETVWLTQELPTERKQENSLRQQKPDIVLNIVAHPMAESAVQSNSLGMSPGTGRNRHLTYVFYDRVEALFRKQIAAAARGRVPRWATTAQILGYAIAHEIGHLLGLSHSPTGIMRNGWRWDDLLNAAYGELGFTPQQAAVIRMELRIREH